MECSFPVLPPSRRLPSTSQFTSKTKYGNSGWISFHSQIQNTQDKLQKTKKRTSVILSRICFSVSGRDVATSRKYAYGWTLPPPTGPTAWRIVNVFGNEDRLVDAASDSSGSSGHAAATNSANMASRVAAILLYTCYTYSHAHTQRQMSAHLHFMVDNIVHIHMFPILYAGRRISNHQWREKIVQ
jgi:hypothetical protein